ncbi:MAG: helix-turn-helix domain-containing protein [Oscillospiraceae bacterium]
MSIMSEIHADFSMCDRERVKREELSENSCLYLQGMTEEAFSSDLFGNKVRNSSQQAPCNRYGRRWGEPVEVPESVKNFSPEGEIYESCERKPIRTWGSQNTQPSSAQLIEQTRAMETSVSKRTKVHDNNKIIAFVASVLATSEFSNSFKMIETPSGENAKYGFKKLAFFKQNDESNMTFWMNSIAFRKNHLYYITKNSYSGTHRTAENLFSLDNIVIDIDNHKDSPKIVDVEVEKLLYYLNSDYNGKFPSYGIVRTGRGLQLWIGLQSVYASPKLQYRYEQLSRIFCEQIDGIIRENNIHLEVDTTASIRANGLVKLPYTRNVKRKDGDNLITCENFPLTRYSFQELFEEYTNVQLPDYSKPEEPKKAVSERSSCHAPVHHPHIKKNDYTGYTLKVVRFLEKLVEARQGNCNGKRELILFLYHNFVSQIYDKETAKGFTVSLNQKFSAPLKESEIRCAVKSDKTYKCSIQKLFFTLSVTEDEKQLYEACAGKKVKREKAKQKKEKRNQRIIELHQNGCSPDEIAQTVGCSQRTVMNILKDSLEKERIDRDSRIVELRQKGMNHQQIAEKMNCNRKTVSSVLKKSGIQFDRIKRTIAKTIHEVKKTIRKKLFAIAGLLSLAQNFVKMNEKMECPKNALCQKNIKKSILSWKTLKILNVQKVQKSPIPSARSVPIPMARSVPILSG